MTYRLASFFINAVAPAFGMLLSLWLIWNVETRFFPVVDSFILQNVQKSSDAYIASGELTKARNCEFLGLTLYAVNAGQPKVLISQFKKDIFGSDVGTGRQTWGPVAISLPAPIGEYERLEIQGAHRCHALWLQSTEYASIEVKRLPR